MHSGTPRSRGEHYELFLVFPRDSHQTPGHPADSPTRLSPRSLLDPTPSGYTGTPKSPREIPRLFPRDRGELRSTPQTNNRYLEYPVGH